MVIEPSQSRGGTARFGAVQLLNSATIGIAIALFVILGMGSTPARSQEAGIASQGPVMFAIPRQSLSSAIQAFSQASGIEVLYESRIASGRLSFPVDGSLVPAKALQILLGDAEFTVRFTGRNSVVLSDSDPQNDLPPAHALEKVDLVLGTLHVAANPEPSDSVRLREFGDVVQKEVETVLRRNSKIRSGNYRISVRLWIDSSRTIQRTELARSTGDRDRDAAIAELLKGFIVSRTPPPNMPQPVRVIVAVSSL